MTKTHVVLCRRVMRYQLAAVGNQVFQGDTIPTLYSNKNDHNGAAHITPTKMDYETMKEKWEANHYFFLPTGTIVEQEEDGTRRHYTRTQANKTFSSWQYRTDTGLKPFLKEWRRDRRRMIGGIVMKMPSDCASDELSYFTGFHYKRLAVEIPDDLRASHVALFTRLLRNIAGDDEPVYTALLKNFARCIQNPLKQSAICIVLSSPHGSTTATTLLDIIRRLIGKNTAHYRTDKAFWRIHDTQREAAILIHLDEVCTSTKLANQLCPMISSSTSNINPPWKRSYTVPNISLYVITTEKPRPFELSSSDWRYFCVACHESNDTWDDTHTDTFTKAVGEYLETVDLQDFNPRAFPVTDYKRSLMTRE